MFYVCLLVLYLLYIIIIMLLKKKKKKKKFNSELYCSDDIATIEFTNLKSITNIICADNLYNCAH